MILNKNNEPACVYGNKLSCTTLMSMSKSELIELLDISQNNYESVNERLFNITKYAEKLDAQLSMALKKNKE